MELTTVSALDKTFFGEAVAALSSKGDGEFLDFLGAETLDMEEVAIPKESQLSLTEEATASDNNKSAITIRGDKITGQTPGNIDSKILSTSPLPLLIPENEVAYEESLDSEGESKSTPGASGGGSFIETAKPLTVPHPDREEGAGNLVFRFTPSPQPESLAQGVAGSDQPSVIVNPSAAKASQESANSEGSEKRESIPVKESIGKEAKNSLSGASGEVSRRVEIPLTRRRDAGSFDSFLLKNESGEISAAPGKSSSRAEGTIAAYPESQDFQKKGSVSASTVTPIVIQNTTSVKLESGDKAANATGASPLQKADIITEKKLPPTPLPEPGKSVNFIPDELNKDGTREGTSSNTDTGSGKVAGKIQTGFALKEPAFPATVKEVITNPPFTSEESESNVERGRTSPPESFNVKKELSDSEKSVFPKTLAPAGEVKSFLNRHSAITGEREHTDSVSPVQEDDGTLTEATDIQNRQNSRSGKEQFAEKNQLFSNGKTKGEPSESSKSFQLELKDGAGNREAQNHHNRPHNMVSGENRSGENIRAHESGPESKPAAPQHMKETVERLSRKMETFIKTGKNEFFIKLHPEDLGALQIRLRTRGNLLTINMVTENQLSKNVIESTLAELKTSLADQGIQTDQFSVTVGREGGSSTTGNSNKEREALPSFRQPEAGQEEQRKAREEVKELQPSNVNIFV